MMEYQKDKIIPLPQEGLLDAESFQKSLGHSHLVEYLSALPDEAFSNLQMLQPETGCRNRCAMCSQGAGTILSRITPEGLRNYISAIKTVVSEKFPNKKGSLVGFGRVSHRPGTIFPYMDNDIASYPYLYEYFQQMVNNLEATIRVSTVGYSRHNPHLQSMHRKIATDFAANFAGIRFSFTPYTYGFTETAERTGRYSRDEYIADLANTIQTYKPVIERLGVGKSTACAEIRFKPLAVSFGEKMLDDQYNGHHFFTTGPYLLINRNSNTYPEESRVERLENGQPVFTHLGQDYLMIISDETVLRGDPKSLTQRVIDLWERGDSDLKELRLSISRERALVSRFSNADGYYYAANPDFQTDGQFIAKHFYQKTDERPRSGYSDAERYFLNNLLRYKKARGVERREEFTDAGWEDAQAVLDNISAEASIKALHDHKAAAHIRENILPQLEAYMKVLQLADIPPYYFFSRNFTVDTGQIVNQGRAKNQFVGLTSQEDLPMTPREERGYGNVSISSQRGHVWRMYPSVVRMPDTNKLNGVLGKKTLKTAEPVMIVSALDTRNLSTIAPDGQILPSYLIPGIEVETVLVSEEPFMQPGQKLTLPLPADS